MGPTCLRWRLALGSAVGSAALVGGLIGVATPAGAATISQAFATTGALQTYPVPAGICAVRVDVAGGSGGDSVPPPFSSGSSAPGGLGAVVVAHLPVDPGTILDIVVGQSGGTGTGNEPIGGTGGTGGYGGGGGGGVSGGGGGGGASAVYDAAGPLVTAGAGGGGVGAMGTAGGNAGVLHHHAAAGGTASQYAGGSGGTTGGLGGSGASIPAASAGGGGGAVSGGASASGGQGGAGSGPVTLIGGGGGAASGPGDVHPGHDAGAGQTGTGGLAHSSFAGTSGNGGAGTTLGGDGADSSTNGSLPAALASAGGGGGGVGFGGGGGALFGGGGGGGLGAGGAGFGGGGGGTSWLTSRATVVSASLASSRGDGTVTVSYDPVADACPPVVLPGVGHATAPSSGTAGLAVPLTLSRASTSTVTVAWTTLVVPGAPVSPDGPQAAAGDYVASSGVVTIAAGDTTAEVHIPVTGDSSPGSEYVVVSFHSPTGAVMGGTWGLGFGIITAAP
jgi:hypothetical protein